jgi:hypothetical protein
MNPLWAYLLGVATVGVPLIVWAVVAGGTRNGD